jgi:hypothetical protein
VRVPQPAAAGTLTPNQRSIELAVIAGSAVGRLSSVVLYGFVRIFVRMFQPKASVYLPAEEAQDYEKATADAFTERFRQQLAQRRLSESALDRGLSEPDLVSLQVWAAIFQMVLVPEGGRIVALDAEDYPELSRVGTQLLTYLNERAQVAALMSYSEIGADILRGNGVEANQRSRNRLADLITDPSQIQFAERAIEAAIAQPVDLNVLLIEAVGYYAEVFATPE